MNIEVIMMIHRELVSVPPPDPEAFIHHLTLFLLKSILVVLPIRDIEKTKQEEGELQTNSLCLRYKVPLFFQFEISQQSARLQSTSQRH